MNHPNAALLARLFSALNQHDPEVMASCYHPAATFEDIAFRLNRREEIHDMWRMICLGESEISVTFEIVQADDHIGYVRAVDKYKFGPARRPVINIIDSHFSFQEDLIIKHHDLCDPHAWASAAIGGVNGFIAGRVPLVRRFMAHRKLKKWVKRNPR